MANNMPLRHAVYRLAEKDMTVPAGFANHSRGYRHVAHVGAHTPGAVHTGYGTSQLDPGGYVQSRVQSFEESYYVVGGAPILVVDGITRQLGRDDCGLIPVGATHSWLNHADAAARWIDMRSPQPRPDLAPADIFFVTPPGQRPQPAGPLAAVDVRDPRTRGVFHLAEGLMDVDRLKVGADAEAPIVSSSMSSALLAYSGIAIKMLVDERLGAELQCMFMVEYQPTGDLLGHDHPFEESHYFLEGEVDFVADGESYQVSAGDILFTGVGCIHSFYNRGPSKVRWLETRAPLPPVSRAYRFERDWNYLAGLGLDHPQSEPRDRG